MGVIVNNVSGFENLSSPLNQQSQYIELAKLKKNAQLNLNVGIKNCPIISGCRGTRRGTGMVQGDTGLTTGLLALFVVLPGGSFQYMKTGMHHKMCFNIINSVKIALITTFNNQKIKYQTLLTQYNNYE